MESHQLVNQHSGVTEWYTDPRVTAAARCLFGGIDVDVASSPEANAVIGATLYYVSPPFRVVGWLDGLPIREYEDRGGLDRRWFGNVWMNCPFRVPERACARNCRKKTCLKRQWHTATPLPGTGDWIKKLVRAYNDGDVKQAITLNFAATSETWFQPLLFWPQCFPSPRLQFFTPEWTTVSGATKGTALTYMGRDLAGFAKAFVGFGQVKIHWQWGKD